MNNKFANNLKKLRKENNLSQEDLAEELGVSRQSISKWESSIAYPEMDKIIQLCEKFNVNIDHLLHHDIKEIKGEEESKKNVNTFIDSFLSFITDSINLLHNMTFKSKIKCLFEMCMVGLMLFLLGALTWNFLEFVFNSLFSFVPDHIYMVMERMLDGVTVSLLSILGIIILLHIFKTRYLEYYHSFIERKEDNNEENIVNENSEKLQSKKEDKIIIRDPSHSEYRFINGVCKFCIFILKLFLAFIALGFALALLGLVVYIVLCFLIIKSGLFFVGALLSGLGAAIFCTVCLFGLLSFIFNYKNKKLLALGCFVLSIIITGVGIGTIINAGTKFEVVNEIDEIETHEMPLNMTSDLFIDYHVTYVEKEIDNIVISYNAVPGVEMQMVKNDYYGCIYFYDYTKDPIKVVNMIIDYINNKKFISFDADVQNITVYASHENIQIMKENYAKYMNDIINNEE